MHDSIAAGQFRPVTVAKNLFIGMKMKRPERRRTPHHAPCREPEPGSQEQIKTIDRPQRRWEQAAGAEAAGSAYRGQMNGMILTKLRSCGLPMSLRLAADRHQTKNVVIADELPNSVRKSRKHKAGGTKMITRHRNKSRCNE